MRAPSPGRPESAERRVARDDGAVAVAEPDHEQRRDGHDRHDLEEHGVGVERALDPARGREAVEIVDNALWNRGRIEATLLRTRANILAQDYMAALDSLLYVTRGQIGKAAMAQAFAKRANELLLEIPNDENIALLRGKVEDKMRILSR